MHRITVAAIALCIAASPVTAQGAPPPPGSTFEIYGFVMTDMGYDFNQVDPDWFDVLRVTKLPAFDDQFGEDGRTYFSARQTRFGVRSTTPTRFGDFKTQFEWELFGVGVDAGQTTIRLRHAYGELGQFGAGQYWSPFMDIDVFPNTVEYWGPPGMAFFRNVQVRWMPVKGDSRVTFALERPGASGDQGDLADRIELSGIRGRFPLPDLSGEGRWGGTWGYVELAGILRWIEWDDTFDDAFDLSGDEVGWGATISSNLKFGARDVARLQVVYGEGVQNYMNDAPVDVAARLTGDPIRPVTGEALEVLGISAFLDHGWNDRFSTAIGYSMIDMGTTDEQLDSSFETGHYAIGNLMYYPVKDVMMGVELQWGRRENIGDDFSVDDFRVQFSFKYNFAHMLGGTP